MGNCCAAEDDKAANTDMKKRSPKKKSKKSNAAKKGRTLTEEEFKAFRAEVKDDQIDDLWSNPGDWDTDDESDSDDFEIDKVTLEKSGDTKDLFKRDFMEKVHEFLAKDVIRVHEDLGAFQYR